MKTKKTVIFMGYTCNNKCTFCCNEDKRKTIKDKSTKEIKVSSKIAEQIIGQDIALNLIKKAGLPLPCENAMLDGFWDQFLQTRPDCCSVLKILIIKD